MIGRKLKIEINNIILFITDNKQLFFLIMNIFIGFMCTVISYYNTRFAISMCGLLAYYILYKKFAHDIGDIYCSHIFNAIFSVIFVNIIFFALPADYRFLLTMSLLLPAKGYFFLFLLQNVRILFCTKVK